MTIAQLIGAIVIIGGSYAMCRLWLAMMQIHQVLRELDREIAADELECARAERRAAALRVIEQNTAQAQNRSTE